MGNRHPWLPSSATSLVLALALLGASLRAARAEPHPSTARLVPGVPATIGRMLAHDAAHPAEARQVQVPPWLPGPGPRWVPGLAPGGPPADLAPPALPADAAPAVESSFVGLIDDGTVIPPDTMGAAGPAHLVSLTNRGYAVFSKTGTIVSGPVSLAAFWSGLGAPAAAPYDPKVIYDEAAARFVAVTDSNAVSSSSHVLVAVSSSSDPTAGWTQFAVKADGAGTLWADYPGLGVDSQNVYVTNNMFTVAASAFTTARFWVITKASLLGGGPLVVTAIDDPTGGFTYQPAHSFGAVTTGYLVGEGWTGGGTSRYLRILRFSGPPGSPALADLGFLRVADYGFATLASAPQLGCASTIATNDSRLLNAVYRDGTLWTTNQVDSAGTGGRSEVAWYALDPTRASGAGTAVPLQQGRIADQGRAYYFPSIAVDGNGCAAIGFTGSDAASYASAYFTVHDPGSPAGTTEPVVLLKAGEAPYLKTFGRGRNRWGDYSATCLDPADGSFWTLQQYARPQAGAGCPTDNTGVWGTWWGSFRCAPNNPPSCAPGGPYAGTCTTARIDGATASDLDGDALSYSWTSSNGQVSLTPASGTIAAGAGNRPVPAATATLAAAPCNVSSTLTLSVQDTRGGGTTRQTSVSFDDTTPPVLGAGSISDCYPTRAAAEAAALAATGVADDCTTAPVSSVTSLGTRPALVTVTARDACGNQASVTYQTRLQEPEACNGLDDDCDGEVDEDCRLEVGDAEAPEGNCASRELSFPVTLSRADLASTVSVSYRTEDGTALAGSDYQALSGLLSFGPGESTRTIRVPLLPDLAEEPDEVFRVLLAAPVNAVLADPSGTGTIRNDDRDAPDAVWHDWFAVDPRETPFVGDFDGDGRDDIITFTRDNPLAFGDVYVALSLGDRYGDNRKWHDWFAINQDEVVVIGDYDGDGRDDIATWLAGRTWQVYVAVSQGTAMSPERVWLERIGSDRGDVLLAGDADGDGRDDLILFARRQGLVEVALSGGTGFADPVAWHRFFAVSTHERPAVGDLDGDGRADILTFATDSPTAYGDVYVALSRGDRFEDGANSIKWHDFFSVDPAQVLRLLDIHGDGRTDVFTFMPRPSEQVYTAQSHGTYLGPNVLVEIPGLTRLATDVPWVADPDGDGMADIVVFHRAEGKVRVHRAVCAARPADARSARPAFPPERLVRPAPGGSERSRGLSSHRLTGGGHGSSLQAREQP